MSAAAVKSKNLKAQIKPGIFVMAFLFLVACSKPSVETRHLEGLDQTPEAVFLDSNGKDTRQAMPVGQYPWSTIGRIVLDLGEGKKSTCTGTLIGHRIVVTAAHCVLVKNKITGIVFQTNYFKGKMRNQALSDRITVGTTDPQTNRAADWAVLSLKAPSGDLQGWMGTIGLTGVQLPLKVQYAGYSFNYQEGAVAGADTNCFIREVFPNGSFGHDCSMGPGGSGGPLFAMDSSGKVYLRAVNTRGIAGGVFRKYNSKSANIGVMNSALLDTVVRYQKLYPQ